MNFPPPTHQSSALHQAALDAMDVGPTLLQSNKARNSQYQNPHWDRTEMGKEGHCQQNFCVSSSFFSRITSHDDALKRNGWNLYAPNWEKVEIKNNINLEK